MTQTIQEFINKFENHPILFIGTGMSMRYLNNSFNWENLLKKVCLDLIADEEHFINLKNEVYNVKTKKYDYAELATIIETEIDELMIQDSENNLYKEINDIFYETMKQGIHTSRLKIYIAHLLENLNFKSDVTEEIKEFKKASKNVGSIITTNYDSFIEDISEFKPLIGNDILLSNPYGSVYKIHGSVEQPENIIINKTDYEEFNEKFELIRAQLLSLFMHNPIIFMGYSISDDNVRKILETIFSYVDNKTNLFDKIRDNFLLVEYSKGSKNTIVTDYDVSVNDTDIRINKLKTDDYLNLYQNLTNLSLPISAMDVRRVSSVVSEIYKGGKRGDSVRVQVTEAPEDLDNSDIVLAIGSQQTISYVHKTTTDMFNEYFKIIEDREYQVIELIDNLSIQNNQFFPIYGFSRINNDIESSEQLREQQEGKIDSIISEINNKEDKYKFKYTSVENVIESGRAKSNIPYILMWNVLEENIELDDFEEYLKEYEGELHTMYRRYLCVYDYLKYRSVV